MVLREHIEQGYPVPSMYSTLEPPTNSESTGSKPGSQAAGLLGTVRPGAGSHVGCTLDL